MLFNSYIFIFCFLPVSFFGFFGLASFAWIKGAKVWLTICSLFFYAYWNVAYLLLLVVSIIFNYTIGSLIAKAKLRSKQAKLLLAVGVSVNLAIIAYYKYALFFFDSINLFARTNFAIPNIILPLAISFYTFTQIAYLVDAYRGDLKNINYDLLNYCLFVTFFPQLVAGPILRHNELIPQLRKLRTFMPSQKNIAAGLTFFSLGLAKKVLIADNLSPWVATVFVHGEAVSFVEAWVGALSYTFQLYFDFSGYSDMAIGLGLLFNVHLPINFNSPYKAVSIIDFWRRWHITLSNFLRDYLYIPLGGSRQGETRRYGNLMITMLLGGFWHGAGWTFIIWGGLHGAYLCINHWWRRLNIALPKLVGWAITFVAVIAGWVLFRAQSLHEGWEILQAMGGMKGLVIPGEPQGKLAVLTAFGFQLERWDDLVYLPTFYGSKTFSILILAVLVGWVTLLPNVQQIVQKLKPTWWWAAPVGVMTGFCLLSLNRVSEFLYFQF